MAATLPATSTACLTSWPRQMNCTVHRPKQVALQTGVGRRRLRLKAEADSKPTAFLDARQMADFIASQPLEEEQQSALKRIADALDIPLGTAKNLVYRKRGVLNLEPSEIASKIATVADKVQVSPEQARQMVVIQPGLLFDTEKQSEALASGIRVISYELNAPREEIVELIIKHPSVLHGRQMHLSVADMANLALLRQPTGRIVD